MGEAVTPCDVDDEGEEKLVEDSKAQLEAGKGRVARHDVEEANQRVLPPKVVEETPPQVWLSWHPYPVRRVAEVDVPRIMVVTDD